MSETIPTADRLPLLGSALEVGRDPFRFLERAPAEYGPVFRVSIPGLSFVCYTDAELVERVLAAESDRYRKDPRELDLLGDLLGEGLLTARGEIWERGREHVQPAFYPGRLLEYGEEMLDRTGDELERWEDGHRIDVHEAATRLTLSIVATTMFGVEDVEETDAIADAADAITSRFEPSRVPMEIPLWVPTPANRRYRRATDDLDDVIEAILRRRRESGGETDADDRPDLCSALLTAGESGALSDAEIRDHLVTMLLAGHETTAIALTYTLGLLASHPDERERVLEEVRAPAELTPRTELPHTDRAIREALRLYPPTYMLYRETATTDTVAGYEISEGTRVCLSQWAVHRNDRYYDDPLEFRPGRWTPEMRESLPEYAYFPFGGGPRQCIGRRFALLELRLCLARILRSVRIESVPETELTPTPALTSRPDGPVPVRVRR
ncbi:cytochrome P450 [Natrarchaeobius chitinivorans]|nr:cytochrome P450 [Natrarchaeobius chitinivorans]